MSHENAVVTPAAAARPGLARSWVLAPGRGLALCGLMLAGTALLLAVAGAPATIGVAVAAGGQHTDRNLVLGILGLAAYLFLLPWALLATRSLASLTRRLAGAWCGVPIAKPYLPSPAGLGKLSYPQRLGWLLGDRATWRDLRWLAVNAAGAWVLAGAPGALAAAGLWAIAGGPALHGWAILIGGALVAAGLAAGPWLLRRYGLVARRMLAPAGQFSRQARRRNRRDPGPATGEDTTHATRAAPGRPSSRRSGRLLAPARGLGLYGLMLAGTALVLALPLVVGGLLHIPVDSTQGFVIGAGLGILLFPVLVAVMRWLANLTRLAVGRWCGVEIARPYRPAPAGPGMTLRQRYRWLWQDPATWRDLLWLVVNAAGAWWLAALPAGLIGLGLAEFIVPALYNGAPSPFPPPAFPNAPAVLTLLGVVLIGTGFAVGPPLLRAYGLLARSLLGPTGRAELAVRMKHLSQTRAETIDAGAAEMRRIERDLHDGAQARLVAMGMTLDAAGQLIGTDPAAARALVLEARDSSARALAELRDLVRGIHPPVLADRGLTEAIRALALDSPLQLRVAGTLAGRAPAPVESAAYFGVSELLANVSKHAGARQVCIAIRHEREMLRIGVNDDGCGGADPARGTGLRGVERRLAAFDGMVTISSPPGGPTVVRMEIPCALS